MKCAICDREITYPNAQRHHLIPRSLMGPGDKGVTVPVHPRCHVTLHSLFTHSELVRECGTPTRLRKSRARLAIKEWMSTKPAMFLNGRGKRIMPLAMMEKALGRKVKTKVSGGVAPERYRPFGELQNLCADGDKGGD